MAGYSLHNLTGGKSRFSGEENPRTLGAIWTTEGQIWPEVSYVITQARVVYSPSAIHPEAVSTIDAKGSNYATVVGTVEKRRGTRVKERYQDVTLIPVNTSQDFYLDGNKIKAYDLGTTEQLAKDVWFLVKYVDDEGRVSVPFYKNVVQEENAVTSTVDEITRIALSLDKSTVFPILGDSATLSAVKHFDRTKTYTSQHTATEAKTEDISTNISYVISGSGASIQSRVNVVVNSREHITTAGAWQITGRHVVEGVTYPGYLNITQTADAIISTEVVNSNARVGMSVSGSSIGATGGSCTLVWSGLYDSTVSNYWISRPTIPITTTYTDLQIPENDMWITGSASYYTRNGASVSHENMVRRTSDSVTYTVHGRVEGLDDVSYPVTITASNSRTKTSQQEVTTSFSIDSSTKVFSKEGGTALLSGYQHWKMQYNYTWGSGAIDTEYSGENLRSVETTFDIAPSSEYSLSGNELTVYANTSSIAKSWTLSGLWVGHYMGATLNITQEAAESIYLSYITVIPNIEGESGHTGQLTVTAYFSDGSSRIVTSLCSFSSADTSVATVSASGLVTIVGGSSTTITASFTSGGITKTDNVTAMCTDTVIIYIYPHAERGAAIGDQYVWSVWFTASQDVFSDLEIAYTFDGYDYVGNMSSGSSESRHLSIIAPMITIFPQINSITPSFDFRAYYRNGGVSPFDL